MQSSKRINWRVKLCGLVFLLAGFQIAVAQVNDPPPVPVTPSLEFVDFINKYTFAEKIDAFYYFRNFPEFKGKVIMLDARLREQLSYNTAYVKMWRNFGTLTVIVTDIPAAEELPVHEPFLLVGLMTGYKNKELNGVLESMPIVKFMGKYVCKDFRCNQ